MHNEIFTRYLSLFRHRLALFKGEPHEKKVEKLPVQVLTEHDLILIGSQQMSLKFFLPNPL